MENTDPGLNLEPTNLTSSNQPEFYLLTNIEEDLKEPKI